MSVTVKTIHVNELDDTLHHLQSVNAQNLAIVSAHFSNKHQQESLYWKRCLKDFQHIYRVIGISHEALYSLEQLYRLKSLLIFDVSVNQHFLMSLQRLSKLQNLGLIKVGLKAADTAFFDLPSLRSLNITNNLIPPEGVKSLAALTQLSALDISRNKIGSEGAKVLAALTQLSSLDISRNHIYSEGTQSLAALTQLSSLGISHNHIDSQGAKSLAALTQLSSLQISSNKIGSEGAKSLATLTQLSSLDISRNHIYSGGAKSLAELTQLSSLEISSNKIGDEGAKSLATLTQLSSLDISNNKIGSEGAESLAALTQLSYLDISNNKIGSGGTKSLAKLTHLSSLDISHNNINSEGAKSLATLTQLYSLDISNNKIGSEGAKSLATLTQLYSLDISNNKIGSEGAKSLAALTQLCSLDISNNDIGSEGAKSLAALTQLSSLDIWNNDIGSEGAKYLAALSQLYSLQISNNKISSEGAKALAALSQLSSLQISNNKISSEGAKALAALSQLSSLQISNNKIGSEGAKSLATLTQLSSLQVSSNNIGDEGTKSLAELSQLSSLSIGFNAISNEGASSLAVLTQLSSLDISSNDIGDESAKALAALTQLSSLDISSNDIGSEGAKALTALTQLSSLDISDNPVEDEGAKALSHLSQLNDLNLAKTNITDLLCFKTLLQKGMRFDLSTYASNGEIAVEDCPLTTPPPEIIEQGSEAVLNYFEQLATGEVDHLYEAKVLVLGEGGHGKTSLIRRLYFPDQALPQEEETTRGIDIHRSSFRFKVDETFYLNIWDFGGQQIYHATHQFFLTKRSLYILVDDTRNSDKTVQDKSFKYWLEVIESLTDKSPVLIFQNEKGGRSKAIDIEGIKKRFPNVVGVFKGDLAQTGSVDALKIEIEHQVQKLDHVGDELPKAWIELRQSLVQKKQNQAVMKQTEYFDLYANTEQLTRDHKKALLLSKYFHDLGIFLHFQDDRYLKDHVILKNIWATDAVFKVLDDEQVKSQQGQFTEHDCIRLWSDAGYADKHLQLLALMEKFELCYQLPDTRPTKWMVPQLLKPSKPENLPTWSRQEGLSLHFRYSFLPKGLVNRLMVRMHRYVKQAEFAWYNGVLFQEDESQVLASLSAQGQEILLEAHGPDAKSLLNVIASDLDAINSTFENLGDKIRRIILCPCPSCLRSDRPHEFEFERLKKRKKDAKLDVECGESYETMSVMRLLEGFDLKSYPINKKNKTTPSEKKISLFLASSTSTELEPDRDKFHAFITRLNNDYKRKKFYFELMGFEQGLKSAHKESMQERYNELIRNCDIFVCLVRSKVGTATLEEVQLAYDLFLQSSSEKPYIYNYIYEPDKPLLLRLLNSWKEDASVKQFKKEISHKSNGQYYLKYKSFEDLERQFRDQLEQIDLDAL